MILEIYLFLAAFDVAVLLLSWYKPQIIMFLWMPAVLSPVLAILSLDITVLGYSGGWQTYLIQDVSLTWLWYGLSAVAIGWAIVNTILILTGFYKPQHEEFQ